MSQGYFHRLWKTLPSWLPKRRKQNNKTACRSLSQKDKRVFLLIINYMLNYEMQIPFLAKTESRLYMRFPQPPMEKAAWSRTEASRQQPAGPMRNQREWWRTRQPVKPAGDSDPSWHLAGNLTRDPSQNHPAKSRQHSWLSEANALGRTGRDDTWGRGPFQQGPLPHYLWDGDNNM